MNSHLITNKPALWIDGSQRITAPLLPLFESLKHRQIATFKHPDRTCVYQEVKACQSLRKHNAELMNRQVARYQKEGYPPFNGLVETAVLFRQPTVEVERFNYIWWEQIHTGSYRDQLSFNYSISKTGIQYVHIPGDRTKSPWFEFVPHGGSR